jgi:pimeloyl-ACP methyl ester carboxylesterase
MPAIWKSPEGAAAVRARYATFLAHWPGGEQRRAPTRHGETFVMVSGPADAPPVVLLHGSASNAASWLGDAPLWGRDFRLYAVDILGEPGLSSDNRPTLASGAYVEWLDDVMAGLGLANASFVGLSLGGWLATDYAIRRPERVDRLVLLAPGGIGRFKNILIWALPLLLLGKWGRERVMARIGGPRPGADAPAPVKAFGAFMELIFTHFIPRREKLPHLSDEGLERLTMPVLVVLGAKDAMIDSPSTRARLEANLPDVQVRWLEDAGHFLPRQTEAVLAFLQGRAP